MSKTLILSFEILFWFCLTLVFYTYIGYGMLMWMLVQVKNYFTPSTEKTELNDENLPEITLFIAAFNEEEVVEMKMQNTYALDYPQEKLHIMWVTDGSNDSTNEKLSAYSDVEVLFSPERRGKTAAINRGMQYVKTSIVVFCDANTSLNPSALKIIANSFVDPFVGCVSGEKRVVARSQDGVSSKGESAYWRYESFLKSLDSQFYSAVGAAGELFAIRKELFEPIAEDALLDDFMLSMKIVQKGYRIAYTPDAYATERGSLNMEEEAKRKKRICAGGLQSIVRLAPLLNPLRYGRFSLMYVSHRVLRWSVTPVALFLLLPASLLLGHLGSNFFSVVFVLQLFFYLLAWAGYRSSKKGVPSKLLYIPYYFVFMNLNVFLGIHYLFQKKNGVWEKTKRR